MPTPVKVSPIVKSEPIKPLKRVDTITGQQGADSPGILVHCVKRSTKGGNLKAKPLSPVLHGKMDELMLLWRCS